MDLRELKALELAARVRIAWEGDAWSVPSQSGNGKYKVTLQPESCTCEDFQLRQQACKHVIAVRIVRERDGGPKAPALDTEVVPVRPTYRQNWPAYNEAQTTEKHRLMVLLHDLCRVLPELPYKGGRRRTPVGDVVFSVAFKVYSTFSSRRFACDLKDAHAKKYVTTLIHPNKVNTHLENPELTPLLRDLIMRSSLPLRTVETDFAPDSSGFSTSRFVRWFDEKYGVHRSGRDWVKVHVMSGVKTHIITAVEIHGRDAADSPQFPAMVNATAQNFTIREVPADKAYLSKENLELVASLGGTAFIPFKSNSIAGEAGSLWERMFFYYNFRREEFLQHYHKRSNVESVFSMIKAKFRDHIRSRVDTAMVNEVLCKILCHNLCVVIASQCELGIEPVFWGNEPTGQKDILPLTRPRIG